MKIYIEPKHPPIHILPIGDLKPHKEGLKCECKPEIKGENETLIIISIMPTTGESNTVS